MKKVSLHVKERIYLMNVMPQENSLVNFQLKKELMNKLEISDEEKTKLKFSVNEKENNVTWDPEIDMANPVEIEFNDQETAYMREAIEKLSDGAHPDEFWLIITTIYDKLSDSKQQG